MRDPNGGIGKENIMNTTNVVKCLLGVIVATALITSLTACVVEPVRYRPLYVEPVHVVVHEYR